MAESKYRKYVIKEPKFITEMAHHDFKPSEVSGFTFPGEVYIDGEILKEANQWLDICWIWEVPNPQTMVGAHSHPFDEIVLLISSNPKDLRDLGGEVEMWMGEGEEAEKFMIDTTTLIYVPKGLVHCPLTFKKVERPILNIAIGLNTHYYG